MPLKEMNSKEKYSSVMYKTTFSSQAKDVRRVSSKPTTPTEKENLPKGFDGPQYQVPARRISSRKGRLSSSSKKPIDIMIAGFRRCFKDAEQSAVDLQETADDCSEQIDVLCEEIAALKADADVGSVEAPTDLSQALHPPSSAESSSPLGEERPAHPAAKAGPPTLRLPLRCAAPLQEAGPVLTKRTSPTAGRDSLSPRGPLAEEPARGRHSPRLPPPAAPNDLRPADPDVSRPSAHRPSPPQQRPVASASQTVRRPLPPAPAAQERPAPPPPPPGPPIQGVGIPTPALPPPANPVPPQKDGPRPRQRLPLAAITPGPADRPAAPAIRRPPPPRPPSPREASSSPPPSEDEASSSGDVLGAVEEVQSPDSRKRKGPAALDPMPRQTRRLSEAVLSPPRSNLDAPVSVEDITPEFVVKIPRSPSPNGSPPAPSHVLDLCSCPSPPLVGPYSPPAPRSRRYSLPPSPIPRLCLTSLPQVAESPLVVDADVRRLAGHEEWFRAQLQLFSSCVPNRTPAVDPDGADSDTSDEDSDAEAAGASPEQSAVSTAPPVTSKYFAEVCARFDDCRRLHHLPTLNLCFTLLDTILMLGNKKHLAVLLRKNNLPKLLAAMQYNPKLNSHARTRPPYLDTMGKRLEALPLPAPITALATTLYQLLFLKDTIIPVVCDEARYMTMNLHIAKTKGRLCEMVFEDRRVLPQLFAELRGGGLPVESRVAHLRFLKEFLELGITAYPGEGSYFWRGVLRDHQLVPLLTECLGDPAVPVRRAAIDVCLLICDEESRKILYGVLPQFPLFLRRLFGVFSDTESPEAMVLQLQATLPMLVASPHADTLPIFYEAAQHVLATWIDAFDADAQRPPHTHISAFMELLSLAIHHHHRTFHYSHDGCVETLVDFGAILWTRCPAVPHSVLIALNKGILSILHVSNEEFHQRLAERDVFRGMLELFQDGNNLLTSSMLTLLHTILQLEIQPLIKHVCSVWFGPAYQGHFRSLSFVQQLFLERQRTLPMKIFT